MIHRKPTRATRFGGRRGLSGCVTAGFFPVSLSGPPRRSQRRSRKGRPSGAIGQASSAPLFRPDRRRVGTYVEGKEAADEVAFDADVGLALRFVGTLVAGGRWRSWK